MKEILFSRFLTILLLSLLLLTVDGKESNDSLKVFKNTIRTNISNPMLFGKNYNVVGYERLLKNNQSVSFNFGRFTLPKFESYYADSLGLNNSYTDKGFTINFDYRFYLKNENKYPAPRGIFFGPYYSYNYIHRDNSWELNTSSFVGQVNSEIKLNINLIGIQMGYQFIIKNRLTIDLIFAGPGIWFYNGNSKLNTTLSPDDESLLFDKINEFLASKLPGHEIILKPGQLEKKGKIKTISMGYRYVMHIGYRF